jgi:FtsH-binding integral membrane protein
VEEKIMSYAMEYQERRIAAEASADARAAFIRRTYGHLALAVLAFTGLEAILLNVVPAEMILAMFGGRMIWLVIVLGFVGVSWLANAWAQSDVSPALQYAGLGLFVVAEAVIFLPILFVAASFSPDIIPKAGMLTLAAFAGLTFVAFTTRHDFSYLGAILGIGSMVLLGVILVGIFFGGGTGLITAFGAVALACGFILYDTSNILHRYRTDQHVAAALALFASIAMLFIWILRILMIMNRR